MVDFENEWSGGGVGLLGAKSCGADATYFDALVPRQIAYRPTHIRNFSIIQCLVSVMLFLNSLPHRVDVVNGLASLEKRDSRYLSSTSGIRGTRRLKTLNS